MSESHPEPESSSGMVAGYRELIVMMAAFGGILSCLFPITRTLLFGWFLFIDRSLATFQPDGPTFWVGLGAFALLSAIVHRLGQRWMSHPGEGTATGCWTWRSTTAICIGITLLFAASVAMVASLHQVIWLAGNAQSTTQRVGRWGEKPGPLSFVGQARQAAWRTQSRNNLKQFILGMHNYESTYTTFPPGAIILPNGRGYRGWLPPLGPYIGFQDEWNGPNQAAWNDPRVEDLGKGALPFLMHPKLGWHGQFDDRGFALMHYAGNVHIFPNNHGLGVKDITDGTANTLGIGEVAENFQPWASPWNRRDPADGINDVPWGFGGPPWQEGAQFALMDGTVRFISRKIDRQVLKALGTPAGGEKIPADVLR